MHFLSIVFHFCKFQSPELPVEHMLQVRVTYKTALRSRRIRSFSWAQNSEREIDRAMQTAGPALFYSVSDHHSSLIFRVFVFSCTWKNGRRRPDVNMPPSRRALNADIRSRYLLCSGLERIMSHLIRTNERCPFLSKIMAPLSHITSQQPASVASS